MTLKEKIQSLLDYINDMRGTSYTDLTTAIVSALESSGISIDVSSLPEYWQEEVADAFDYAKSLGSGYVHHVAIADSHYSTNNRNSIKIANVLMATGKFDKFIHLGDLTDTTSKQQYELALEDGISVNNGSFLFAVGNHDEQIGSGDTFVQWKDGVYYDDLMSKSDSSIEFYDRSRCICTYDDAARKIRYICIDYSYAVSDSDKTWFYNKVGELDESWLCVILGHYCFVPDHVYAEYSKPRRLEAMISLADCKVLGLITGHMHTDDIVDYDGIFNQVALLNDASFVIETVGNGEYQYVKKHAGTIDENAVTVISINKSKGVAKFHRVGNCVTSKYGKDFEITAKTKLSKWIEGHYFSNDGYVQSGELCAYKIGSYKVDEGEKYSVYNTNSGWNPKWFGICFYSSRSANDFISRVTPNVSNNRCEFVAPEGAKYALVSVEMNGGEYLFDTIVFEKSQGQEAPDIPEEPLEDIVHSSYGVPYSYSLIENEYYKKDGEVDSFSEWSRTPKLATDGCEAFRIVSSTTATFEYNVAYSENGSYFANFIFQSSSSAGIFINLSSDVYSFGISSDTAKMNDLVITPFGVDESVESGKPYVLDFYENLYVQTNGAERQYNGWKATKPLYCEGFSRIERTGISVQMQYAAFYNKKMEYLASGMFGANENSINVPDGAVFYRISDANANMDSLVLTPYL